MLPKLLSLIALVVLLAMVIDESKGALNRWRNVVLFMCIPVAIWLLGYWTGRS